MHMKCGVIYWLLIHLLKDQYGVEENFVLTNIYFFCHCSLTFFLLSFDQLKATQTKHLISFISTLQDLINRYKYQRGYDSAGLLWEQKAVEVVSCIHVPSYKVDAVVELARYCHVPWSKCISDIVDTTCRLTNGE